MKLSIMTLSITMLNANDECHYAECHKLSKHAWCHYAECRGAGSTLWCRDNQPKATKQNDICHNNPLQNDSKHNGIRTEQH